MPIVQSALRFGTSPAGVPTPPSEAIDVVSRADLTRYMPGAFPPSPDLATALDDRGFSSSPISLPPAPSAPIPIPLRSAQNACIGRCRCGHMSSTTTQGYDPLRVESLLARPVPPAQVMAKPDPAAIFRRMNDHPNPSLVFTRPPGNIAASTSVEVSSSLPEVRRAHAPSRRRLGDDGEGSLERDISTCGSGLMLRHLPQAMPLRGLPSPSLPPSDTRAGLSPPKKTANENLRLLSSPMELAPPPDPLLSSTSTLLADALDDAMGSSIFISLTLQPRTRRILPLPVDESATLPPPPPTTRRTPQEAMRRVFLKLSPRSRQMSIDANRDRMREKQQPELDSLTRWAMIARHGHFGLSSRAIPDDLGVRQASRLDHWVAEQKDLLARRVIRPRAPHSRESSGTSRETSEATDANAMEISNAVSERKKRRWGMPPPPRVNATSLRSALANDGISRDDFPLWPPPHLDTADVPRAPCPTPEETEVITAPVSVQARLLGPWASDSDDATFYSASEGRHLALPAVSAEGEVGPHPPIIRPPLRHHNTARSQRHSSDEESIYLERQPHPARGFLRSTKKLADLFKLPNRFTNVPALADSQAFPLPPKREREELLITRLGS